MSNRPLVRALLAVAALASVLLLVPTASAGANTTRAVKASAVKDGKLIFKVRGVSANRVGTARVRIGGVHRRLRVNRVRRGVRRGTVAVRVTKSMLRSTRRLKRLRRIENRRAKRLRRMRARYARQASASDIRARQAVRRLTSVRKQIRREAAKAKLELNIKPVPQVPAPPVQGAGCDVSGVARYVSPSGSDSNSGSSDSPWKSLAKAESAAAPGTTIVLRAGSYGARGSVTVLGKSGSEGSPIRLVAAAGESVNVAGQLRVMGNHRLLCGLGVNGASGSISPSSENPTGGVPKLRIEGDHVELRNSEVSGSAPHSGVYLHEAYSFRLINNYIHDNGAFNDPSRHNLDHGVYVYKGSGLIEGNRFVHNLAHAVQLYPYANGVTVRNNTMTGHGRSAVIFADQASNNIVENNKIYGNASGIQTYDLSGTNNIARNNELYNNRDGNFVDAGRLSMSSNNER